MVDYRNDFPFFINNPEINYLDSAATTQKPQSVLDTLREFYTYDNAPVHRAVYTLAERATERYEHTRVLLANYLGAESLEIVFTKGTTESINFVCQAWAAQTLEPGDEILISELEHHANILPWLRLAQQKNLILKYIPLTPEGDLDYEKYYQLVTLRTKLIAITACSNAIGVHIDLERIIAHARANNIRTLVDGTQIAGREHINLRKLGVDFFACSAHKMLGPTGVGVLYIKKELHSQVEPYQVGGGMVADVSFTGATWLNAPHKFEAGTPPIAQVIAYGAAVEYLRKQVNFAQVRDHEKALTACVLDAVQRLPAIRILGSQENLRSWGHMVSFASSKYHAHDIAAYLDQYAICVRAGNQCAQPLHKKLGVTSSVRISFYLYTTHEEVERCLYHLIKLFS